jgi:archaellum component FlaC
MAARRKSAKKQRGDDGADVRAFTVVVEDINAKINVFGESLQAVDGLRASVDEVRASVDEVRASVGEVRASVDDLRVEMRAGFQLVDQRFEKVDRDFSLMKTEIGLVKTAVLENSREIKGLRRTVEDRDARKVDRAELTSPRSG